MNRNTRNLVILGVIVLAVAILVWTFAAREQARLVALPADTVAAMEKGAPDEAPEGALPHGEPARGGAAAQAPTSICDDLAVGEPEGRVTKDPHTRGVIIYEGEPKRNLRMARDPSGDSTYWVWKLPASRTGYWIECSYEGNEVRARRLPDEITECRVALAGSSKEPLIRGVACS